MGRSGSPTGARRTQTVNTASDIQTEKARAGSRVAGCSVILCAATNPDQRLTLYEDGRVRVHTRNLDTAGRRPYRTLDYRPKLKSDREAIHRLIWHLNLCAAGSEGIECKVFDCFSPNDRDHP